MVRWSWGTGHAGEIISVFLWINWRRWLGKGRTFLLRQQPPQRGHGYAEENGGMDVSAHPTDDWWDRVSSRPSQHLEFLQTISEHFQNERFTAIGNSYHEEVSAAVHHSDVYQGSITHDASETLPLSHNSSLPQVNKTHSQGYLHDVKGKLDAHVPIIHSWTGLFSVTV